MPLSLPLIERTLHDAVTWYMVGVIWLVQLVQYPMFQYLDRSTFTRSHAFHTGAIGFVVMPAMLVELALAAAILWRRGSTDPPALIGAALIAVIWATTFVVIVPLHGRLGGEGFRLDVFQSLIRWNWVRTIAWTARGILAAFILWSPRN